MILPRFRFLTISSKKLWIWKKLENGSPRKKMHFPWVFHFFFFRGCILQVFRDPAFFRRFWPGFFFSETESVIMELAFGELWHGRGGFVIHSIEGVEPCPKNIPWVDSCSMTYEGVIRDLISVTLACWGHRLPRLCAVTEAKISQNKFGILRECWAVSV